MGLLTKTTVVFNELIGRLGEFFIHASYNFVWVTQLICTPTCADFCHHSCRIGEDKTVTWPHNGGHGPVVPPFFFTRASVINCISLKQGPFTGAEAQGN